MRILFLSPVGSIGGAERVMLDCIAALRAIDPGIEVHLLLMDDGPLELAAREVGATVTVMVAPRGVRGLGDSAMKGGGAIAKAGMLWRMICAMPGLILYSRRVGRATRGTRADLVHSNGVKAHLVVGLARPAGPVLWHIHDFVGTRPMIARVLRRVARRMSNVHPIAISNAVAADVRRWLPESASVSAPVVILNGIDLERFKAGAGDGAQGERTGLDELAGLARAEPETLRVGLVATYARWKGQDIFLRAAAKVLKDSPGQRVRFYIIGGPIYTTAGSQFSREELVALTTELGIAQHVGLVPFQSDTASVYRSLDIVVHASTQPEPFGLTIAEAMACGRPVIVSTAGGASELVQDGLDAVTVEPGDASSLAEAIKVLVADLARRTGLGRNARSHAELRFNRSRMGDQLASLYRTLASHP